MFITVLAYCITNSVGWVWLEGISIPVLQVRRTKLPSPARSFRKKTMDGLCNTAISIITIFKSSATANLPFHVMQVYVILTTVRRNYLTLFVLVYHYFEQHAPINMVNLFIREPKCGSIVFFVSIFTIGNYRKCKLNTYLLSQQNPTTVGVQIPKQVKL